MFVHRLLRMVPGIAVVVDATVMLSFGNMTSSGGLVTGTGRAQPPLSGVSLSGINAGT